MEHLSDYVLKFINQTKKSIFLTGKAGTGKTTLLKKIVENTHKQTVIVAPTGIAALNAGGVTIHSFFQLPFCSFIPDFSVPFQSSNYIKIESKDSLRRHFKMNKARINLFRNLELLIIDEVSMLRSDLLDAMDWTLRNVRQNNVPYGGVQVLFIGDLHQLPPVVKQEEWSILHKYYTSIYFFNAHVVHEQQPIYIELEKIYRQQNEDFIRILNNLRNNKLTTEDCNRLNTLYKPGFKVENEKGYITLTTHNAKADKLNSTSLNALKTPSKKYKAEITGDFPPHLFPIEEELELKIGAQVMFIKNDLSFEKAYYNGKMGIVKSMDNDEIVVECTDDKKKITVDKYEWENIKYSQHPTSGEIEEETIGTFVHYPIKLAWAITVHKSQGLTFEKAVLDVADVFAPGQAYVALSRLRTLDGLVLLSPFKVNGLVNDQNILDYSTHKADVEVIPNLLEAHSHRYIFDYLTYSFDWYGMTSKWNSHEATYANLSSKSEKSKTRSWMQLQNQRLQSTSEPAKKFRNQLVKLFTDEGVKKEHILERVNAAYNYFFPIFDGVYASLIKQIVALQKVRKTKQYAEELVELEEELFETIIALKKAVLLVEGYANGQQLDKHHFDRPEIKNYRVTKLALLKNELRQSSDLLNFEEVNEEEIVIVRPNTSATKTAKKKKTNTFEQTLSLWEEGKDIRAIAKERKLTVNTVYTHFSKLIQQEKIAIEDILDSQKLTLLKDKIAEPEATSLSDMKDLVGSKVTWDELKLYRASFLI